MPKILICKSKMPDKTKSRSKRQMANSDKSKICHENSCASKGHLQLETHACTHACTHTTVQRLFVRDTRVGWYQKKHSTAHTHEEEGFADNKVCFEPVRGVRPN